MKVVDSSFCADFLRGREYAKRYRLENTDETFVLPSIALYELYFGAMKLGRDPTDIDRTLPWVDRLEYDRTHAIEGARIRNELESNGQRIPHPDTMIAGVARSLDVPVVTCDGDFDRVSELTVENPRQSYR